MDICTYLYLCIIVHLCVLCVLRLLRRSQLPTGRRNGLASPLSHPRTCSGCVRPDGRTCTGIRSLLARVLFPSPPCALVLSPTCSLHMMEEAKPLVRMDKAKRFAEKMKDHHTDVAPSENDFEATDKYRWARFLFIEFVGTMIYVMLAAGSVLSTGFLTFQWSINEQSPGRILCIAFCQGFGYSALLYSVQSFLDNRTKRMHEVEKSHEKFPEFRDWPVGYFNPALTLACAITTTRHNFRKLHVTQISWTVTLIYTVLQFFAATVAGGMLYWMMYADLTVAGRAQLGTTLPGDGTSVEGVLLMETLTSFVMVLAQLMLLVRGEATHHDDDTRMNDVHMVSESQKLREARGYVKDAAPFVLGLLHVILVCISISTSGASMNPARSFGVAVISGQWVHHWIYWAGPYGGAMLAALAFNYFGAFPKESRSHDE